MPRNPGSGKKYADYTGPISDILIEMKKEPKHAALYRTYRPQSFAEVQGQEAVTRVLEAAVKNKEIGHAYLFSGTRGTGKTTIARIFAHAIGATDKDIYEIDAASNNGVDYIRELREAVNTMPFESPYKVYIVDEAHMLSNAAWNAFLKTLEEPPAHVVFILATTELDRVPDTIQSRCQVHIFKQPGRELLSLTITNIAKLEGYAVEPAAAELIALLAQGSFRDALSTLQKILTATDAKKVTLADVEEVTGAPKSALVNALVLAMADADSGKALAAVSAARESGADMRIFTELLMQRMRAILLMRHAKDLEPLVKKEFNDDDWKLVHEVAAKGSGAISTAALRKFLEAYREMAYAVETSLPLELALIETLAKTS